jgi:DNA-binding transcriptional regulator YiaG
MTIQEARKMAGLSRTEMAKQFLIPYRTLQNWELNIRECPPWAERLIIQELNNIANKNQTNRTK